MATRIFKEISGFYPSLVEKLIQAGMIEKPEAFVRKSIMASFFITSFVTIVIFLVFDALEIPKFTLFLIYPVLAFLLFLNLMKRPDVIIKRSQRKFDEEIVFAGKFLIIELRSGVPVYNAMVSVTKTYPAVGKYFSEILNRVEIGTSLEDAINESIELTPSDSFRKILWQTYNSLKTGSDLASALDATINQMVADQLIQVKDYGKKLNPIIMFYMVIAVIFPSIGIIMFIVFSSFFSISVSLLALMLVAIFIALIQLTFIMIIRSQRPSVGVQ